MSGLSAAKKRFALSEETDLEATTEESIECVSSSDLEKSKKDEDPGKTEKVQESLIVSTSPIKATLFSHSIRNTRGFVNPAEAKPTLQSAIYGCLWLLSVSHSS